MAKSKEAKTKSKEDKEWRARIKANIYTQLRDMLRLGATRSHQTTYFADYATLEDRANAVQKLVDQLPAAKAELLHDAILAYGQLRFEVVGEYTRQQLARKLLDVSC